MKKLVSLAVAGLLAWALYAGWFVADNPVKPVSGKTGPACIQ